MRGYTCVLFYLFFVILITSCQDSQNENLPLKISPVDDRRNDHLILSPSQMNNIRAGKLVSPSTNTEEIFKAVVFNPIPNEITNLQGGGYQWQGYRIHLRFAAPKHMRIKLLKTDSVKSILNIRSMGL